MINIKEQKMTIEIDKDGSNLLTSALNCLINWKKNNHCDKKDCEDCVRQGNDLKEEDIEKLAKDIQDLYFVMYKISMSTTKIPALNEIKSEIK